MFAKIVSQLSLSPSAASQLVFYARRLKAERITRTFSAIAAVLIVGLQFATIAAPPAASNAASPNDIIYGGIVSKDDLLNHYDGSAELKALYAHFGISRQDVVNSHVATINSSNHSLNSIGRDQHLASDDKITVGSHTYWARGLYTWDTGSNKTSGSSYKVLEGTRTVDGGYFAVMFACGNIVFKHLPAPPPPPPPSKPPKPSPTPTPTPTPSPTPKPIKPTLACTQLLGDAGAGSTTGTVPVTIAYTGSGTATGQTITEYDFSFGDGKVSNQPTPTVKHPYATVGKFVATLKVKGSTGAVSSTPPACTYTVNVTPPPAAFTKSKSALNLTQNIDATTKPAAAGDQIRYILTTKNTGGVAAPYTVVEHLEDVLEYTEVTDADGGSLVNDVMTWPGTTIQPGATLTKTVTVTVKDPIPDTPVGLSNKFSYDLRLDNVYGNAVSVNIQPPLPKQIEAAATSLPDTGAPAATVIVLLVCAMSLFFYFRNRQLMTEIKLLRGDYQGGNY